MLTRSWSWVLDFDLKVSLGNFILSEYDMKSCKHIYGIVWEHNLLPHKTSNIIFQGIFVGTHPRIFNESRHSYKRRWVINREVDDYSSSKSLSTTHSVWRTVSCVKVSRISIPWIMHFVATTTSRSLLMNNLSHYTHPSAHNWVLLSNWKDLEVREGAKQQIKVLRSFLRFDR